MKHKTWFRLVLKAIGVLLVGFSLPRLIDTLLTISDYLFNWSSAVFGGGAGGGPRVAFLVLQAVPQLVQLAFGLYLFFGGAWIVNKAIPSNRPYCPECGYDLSSNAAERCPDCGVSLPTARGDQP